MTLKIVQINDYYRELGGTEKYFLDICSVLEENGHQIITVSSTEGAHISVKGRTEYFVRPSFGVRSGLRTWSAYKSIIAREKPDIIHLHNTHFFVSPLIINRLAKAVPTVKFVHDMRFLCPMNGQKVLPSTGEICHFPLGWKCITGACLTKSRNERRMRDQARKYISMSYDVHVSRSLDKVIMGSQFMHDELKKNGFQEDRLRLIPCFTDKISPADEAVSGKGVILCVGRFDGAKGIPQFIETLAYIRDRRWTAEIVGDGKFRGEAETKIAEYGLGDSIKLLGRLSPQEVDRCYQRCDIVVMPSMVPESFGLVGIEAAAFGKPVIAFDSGGVREWLVDGTTGYLVKMGDVRELARTLAHLLDNASLARDMGRKGKERVEKYYRRDMHMEKLLATYREVISARRSGGFL